MPGRSAIVEAVEVSVNVIANPAGPSIPELGALGVRRISTGGSLARAAYGAVFSAARELQQRGTSTYLDGMLTWRDFQDAVEAARATERTVGALEGTRFSGNDQVLALKTLVRGTGPDTHPRDPSGRLASSIRRAGRPRKRRRRCGQPLDRASEEIGWDRLRVE